MACSAPGPGLDQQGVGPLRFGGGALGLTVALGPLCPHHTQPRCRSAGGGIGGRSRHSAVAPPPPTAPASLRPQASSLPITPPGVWDAKEIEGSKLPGRVGRQRPLKATDSAVLGLPGTGLAPWLGQGPGEPPWASEGPGTFDLLVTTQLWGRGPQPQPLGWLQLSIPPNLTNGLGPVPLSGYPLHRGWGTEAQSWPG